MATASGVTLDPLRRRAISIMRSSPLTSLMVETVRPEAPGRVLLGDAEWTAVASERLDPGTEVKVVGRKNLTLEVEKLA